MSFDFEDAKSELKRADHLFYVSLKYTRTVDVIRSILDRLTNATDAISDELLNFALEEKMIDEKPENMGLKGELVKKVFDTDIIYDMVMFGLYLKKLTRAEYTSSREFRRHVTMTAIYDAGIVEINIDVIKEYYFKTRSFLEAAEGVIFGEET